mgnify:CR=1 FL=1|jgi:hypothetical protein
MYPNYYFYIKLTPDSDWFLAIGHSLTHVMALHATFDTVPYAYIKGKQL